MVAVGMGPHQNIQFLDPRIPEELYYLFPPFIFSGIDQHMKISLTDQRGIPLSHINIGHHQFTSVR